MIIKSYEILKKTSNFSNYNLFLLYGENLGLKKDIKESIKKSLNEKNSNIEVLSFYESDINNNEEIFYNSIFSGSLFSDKKIITIYNVTDKLIKQLEDVADKFPQNIILIIFSDILEKKSKIRSFFEKNKKTICVPFYEDNNQTLSTMVNIFFKERKLPISREVINLITSRSRGDRQNLNNELQKIDSFIKNKSNINSHDIMRLTNLAENYNVSELIDSCLSKNRNKTVRILNENNYSLEDCIIIIRSFLIKSKRLFKLSKENKNKKNIDSVISNFKPPIFWKDKEIVKKQMQNWSYESVEKLIYEINDIELLIKKYSNNSINILSDFIIDQSTKVSN